MSAPSFESLIVAASVAPATASAASLHGFSPAGTALAILPLAWIATTALIGALSGWYTLMSRYPDTRERSLLRLGFRSGSMGPLWVHMGGVLTLEACQSGLRVSIWRIFGLFSRPFLVPWGQISARPITYFMRPMVRLDFGDPAIGVLRIDARSWDVLSEAARGAGRADLVAIAPITDAQLARNAVLQWALGTTVMAGFLWLAPTWLRPGAPHLPVSVCLGLPAAVMGIGSLIQYVVESRRT